MNSNDAHNELLNLSEEFHTFSREDAHDMIDLPGADIDNGLDDLVDSGVLHQFPSDGGNDAFEFNHGPTDY